MKKLIFIALCLTISAVTPAHLQAQANPSTKTYFFQILEKSVPRKATLVFGSFFGKQEVFEMWQMTALKITINNGKDTVYDTKETMIFIEQNLTAPTGPNGTDENITNKFLSMPRPFFIQASFSIRENNEWKISADPKDKRRHYLIWHFGEEQSWKRVIKNLSTTESTISQQYQSNDDKPTALKKSDDKPKKTVVPALKSDFE